MDVMQIHNINSERTKLHNSSFIYLEINQLHGMNVGKEIVKQECGYECTVNAICCYVKQPFHFASLVLPCWTHLATFRFIQ